MSRTSLSRSTSSDQLGRGLTALTGVSAALCALVVSAVILTVVSGAWPALKELGPKRFLFDTGWHPAEGLYGMAPIIVGSLAVVSGAILIATPFGILSALFLNFYAPRIVGNLYRSALELLGGIPSVVFGLWGMTTVVPLLRRIHSPGSGLLAGSLVLSLMIIPTFASLADAAVRAVPSSLYASSLALGLRRWHALWTVVLPSARSGLAAALVLQTGRAVGETMVVLMVCGNIPLLPKGLFDPIRTLTANVALEMPYALGIHRSALFVSGLVVLMLVVGLMVLVERVRTEE